MAYHNCFKNKNIILLVAARGFARLYIGYNCKNITPFNEVGLKYV